ncbi:hypothetical protein [Salinicoccus roseus]|uniref:hypothetical protein n=1 Tax=Salinicoccus roseus TaxID=45670 RepID=UPI002300ADA9|nr:hypothetical protein [Salinicoccus roseus]
MTKYYKHNEEDEKALIDDLNILVERSPKVRVFERSNLKDFIEEKQALEKSYNTAPNRKQKDIKRDLEKINEFIEKYTHAWVMQMPPKSYNEKSKKKALTVIYRTRKDGTAEVDVEIMKLGSNLGRAGLGAILLFAGPIGWVVGGTVGLTGVVGLRNNSKALKEVHRLIDKNLQKEDIQSSRL